MFSQASEHRAESPFLFYFWLLLLNRHDCGSRDATREMNVIAYTSHVYFYRLIGEDT